MKPSIQHISDGGLPATARLDLKKKKKGGLPSAKPGIKKHFHTSISNQSSLLFKSNESFHVNTTPPPKLHSRSEKDRAVIEDACVDLRVTILNVCVNTLSLLLILPVTLCVRPVTLNKLPVIPLLHCEHLCL